MPRSDSLEGYIGRRVRAIKLDNSRIEGILESISHQDIDDELLIGTAQIRLGKLQRLFVLGEGEKFQVWPPSEIAEEEPPETVTVPFDPEVYEKATDLLGKSVVIKMMADDLLHGSLEAISPRNAANGPVLHLGRGEGQTTLIIKVQAIVDVWEATGDSPTPLTVNELETVLLPGDDGYPFTGKAKTSKAVESIAAEVLEASRSYSEPLETSMANAARFYGLDPVAAQSVQAYIARLTDVAKE